MEGNKSVRERRPMERKLERLKGWMEEREEEVRTIIEGDFNARTGEDGVGGGGRAGRRGKK